MIDNKNAREKFGSVILVILNEENKYCNLNCSLSHEHLRPDKLNVLGV